MSKSVTPEAAAAIALQSLLTLPVVNAPAVRTIRRQWSKLLQPESAPYVLRFTKPLLDEAQWSTRLLACEILAHHEQAFASLNDRRIESMARGLADWGSVDLFGVTLSGPAWLKGRLSTARVRVWARSRDRWRRRLALVSTVRLNVPGRDGRGDAERTLDVCGMLVSDRDPIVVKALSWALRALAKRDRKAVNEFVVIHREALPALVNREVRNWLASK